MKKIVISVILVAIVVAAAWYLVPRPVEEEPPAPPPPARSAPQPPPRAEPVAEPAEPSDFDGEESEPAEPERPPLPSLTESDPAVIESAAAVTGEETGLDLLVRDNILPRVVATIDALTARQVPSRLLPLETPVVPFQADVDVEPPTEVTNEAGDVLEQYRFDPVNYDRYEPYVRTLESMDADRFAAEYLRYAPLLQQAYQDLGYPEGDFTDRLLEVIDHLLETPQPDGPVYLVKPEAYYEFVDPELEALTAGQKALIRMGPDRAERVKRKLVEFRAALGG